jgi:hypothetical protein
MPIHELNPIDPRNPNHPIHDEAWLALAVALGRAAADADWDRLQKDKAEKCPS